jgi:hypothetical protein
MQLTRETVMRRQSVRRRALGAALVAAAALLIAAVAPSTAASFTPSCSFVASVDPFSDLGKHGVGWSFGCDRVPDGQEGSDWSSARVRITTNRPFRAWDSMSLFASACSVSATVIDCATGGLRLSDGIENGGRIAFKRTLLCGPRGGLTFTAQYTLRTNTGEQAFQASSVRGPCAGQITLKGVPKGCTSRNFKLRAKVPAALRNLLLDATYGRLNDERSISVELARRGQQNPRLLGLFFIRDFSVTIPARRLRAGRYALRVGLESNSLDDYPAVTVPFKRC